MPEAGDGWLTEIATADQQHFMLARIAANKKPAQGGFFISVGLIQAAITWRRNHQNAS